MFYEKTIVTIGVVVQAIPFDVNILDVAFLLGLHTPWWILTPIRLVKP